MSLNPLSIGTIQHEISRPEPCGTTDGDAATEFKVSPMVEAEEQEETFSADVPKSQP